MQKLYFILLSSILFVSCYKDSDDSTENVSIGITSITVEQTKILGEYPDKTIFDGGPLQLVVGDETFEVFHSVFTVELNHVSKYSQPIYLYNDKELVSFTQSNLIENTVNYISFPIIDGFSTNPLQSSNPSINVNDQIKIQLPMDGIESPDGDIENLTYSMHQSLDVSQMTSLASHGINRSGHLLQLEISAYFDINITNENEVSINIRPERTATLSTTGFINQSLFYFDENVNRWVFINEISEADIKIASLGMYAIANYEEAVIYESQFVRENRPLAFQKVSIDNSFASSQIVTTSNGKWVQVLSSDKITELTINNPCGSTITNIEIEVGIEDLKASPIEINTISNDLFHVKTQIFSCGGELQLGGEFVIEDQTQERYYAFSEMNIDVWLSKCNENITLAGYNIDSAKKGVALPWSDDITKEIGFLSNCENFENGYSYVTINNEMKIYEPFNVSIDQERTVFKSQDNDFRFKIKGVTRGSYNEDEILIYINDTTFGNAGYNIECENSAFGCGVNECVITHFNAGDENWIRVHFKGDLWMRTISPELAAYYPVEGVILSKL